MNDNIFTVTGYQMTILAAVVSAKLVENLDVDERIILERFLRAVARDALVVNTYCLYERTAKEKAGSKREKSKEDADIYNYMTGDVDSDVNSIRKAILNIYLRGFAGKI